MSWGSSLVSSVTACSNLCQLCLPISLSCSASGASSHCGSTALVTQGYLNLRWYLCVTSVLITMA